MGKLLTRKEIGDKWGKRSCYVVEYRDRDGNGNWEHPSCASDCYSSTYRGAVIIKEKYYREFKKANKTWTRKDFRIALYVRAKRE